MSQEVTTADQSREGRRGLECSGDNAVQDVGLS